MTEPPYDQRLLVATVRRTASQARTLTRTLGWILILCLSVSIAVQPAVASTPNETPSVEATDTHLIERAGPTMEMAVRNLGGDSSDDVTGLDAGGADVVGQVFDTVHDVADPTLPPVMLGMASRLSEESDVLDNAARAEIHDQVVRSPGISMSETAERTGIPLSTVRYHTWVLSSEDVIEEAKIRGKRRLYPTLMDEQRKELTAAMTDDATESLLDTVQQREPASVSELAEATDRSASTVSYHLQRLQDAGLIERERDGGATLTRLDPFVRAELSGEVNADGGTTEEPPRPRDADG